MIVTFGKSIFELNDINDEASIKDLKERLSLLSGMDTVRLIENGVVLDDQVRVMDLNKGRESKLMMIGSRSLDTTDRSSSFRVLDDLSERPTKLVRDSKSQPKPQRKQPLQYGFGNIDTLSGFSDEWKARELLETLANDPGILAVMKKHQWSVGSLCEMFPEGYVGVSDVCVMGLNENKGARILLRLRTDDLQGFRKFLSIKKVLFHELAHNVHSEHDDNFYILMRTIEEECNALDWRNSTGHTLSKSVTVYRGAEKEEHYGTDSKVYHLGGESESLSKLLPAELLAANAAMLRAQSNALVVSEANEVSDNTVATDSSPQDQNGGLLTKEVVVHSVEESCEKVSTSDERNSEMVVEEKTTESTPIEENSANEVDVDYHRSLALFEDFLTKRMEESISTLLMGENSSTETIIQKLLVLKDAVNAMFFLTANDVKEHVSKAVRVLKLALKLLSNIKNEPSNSKYHMVKKSNSTIQQALVNVSQFRDILVVAGFQENEAGFKYTRSDPALLYIIVSLLEEFSQQSESILT